MTTSSELHEGVASYILGVMPLVEISEFEDHLITCSRCLDEAVLLDDTAQHLSRLSGLLGSIISAREESAISHADAKESSSVAQALGNNYSTNTGTVRDALQIVAKTRRGAKRRRMLLALAATAAIIAGPAIILTAQSNSSTPTIQAAPPTSGKIYTATNPRIGVTGTTSLLSKKWGSEITLRLEGVKGPENCRLLVFDHDKTLYEIGGWTVPAPEYGVPANPDPLILRTSTELQINDIDHFEVRTSSGKNLLTIKT
ncbi:hypothetical protein [Streptomyces sp. NPDC055109]